MLQPFDTSHLTRLAERHRLPSDTERAAGAMLRGRRLAEFRAFVALVFAQAPRHSDVPAFRTPAE